MTTFLKSSDWLSGLPIALRVGGGEYWETPPPGDYTEIKHHHDFDELTVIAEGRGMHWIDGQDYEVEAGDVLVIRQDQSHYFHHRRGMVHLNLMYIMRSLPLAEALLFNLPGFKALFTIEPNLLHKKPDVASLKLSPTQLQQFRSMWRVMKQEEEERLPGYEVAMIARFQEVIVFLSRLYAGRSSRTTSRIMAIENSMRFMEANYDQALRLEDLYSKAGMSRPVFMKHFKDSTGLSPMVYLSRIRVEHACELLRSSEATITEIAFETGFSDSNYFSRTFRKVTGRSARAYRKEAAARR